MVEVYVECLPSPAKTRKPPAGLCACALVVMSAFGLGSESKKKT